LEALRGLLQVPSFSLSLSLSLSLSPFLWQRISPSFFPRFAFRVPVRQLDFVVEKSRCCNLDPRLVAFIAIFRISIIQWKWETMEIVAVAGKSGRARSIFLRSPYSSYLRARARARDLNRLLGILRIKISGGIFSYLWRGWRVIGRLKTKFTKLHTVRSCTGAARNNVVWQFAENLFVISSALTSSPGEEQPR